MTKYALLIGINYTGTDWELGGCVNDVRRMLGMYLQNGVPVQNTYLMTDEYTNPNKPTRVNILGSLNAMVSQLKSGDTMYFHYSGHGSQIVDTNGDEADGMDEVLVPMDAEKSGVISDDQLRGIVNRVPEGARFIGIIDACNSGSSFDLRYVYDPVTRKDAKKRGTVVTRGNLRIDPNHLLHRDRDIPPTKGNVIVLSGCLENQTSADVMYKGMRGGALTFAFLETSANKNPDLESLPVVCRDFIINNKMGGQIPRLTFGNNNFILKGTKFF